MTSAPLESERAGIEEKAGQGEAQRFMIHGAIQRAHLTRHGYRPGARAEIHDAADSAAPSAHNPRAAPGASVMAGLPDPFGGDPSARAQPASPVSEIAAAAAPRIAVISVPCPSLQRRWLAKRQATASNTIQNAVSGGNRDES